mmetsp:Transcript_13882/g.30081  ORF Transcript_13882/g.30081 Transcript_13882/m.30081 type:complete len:204 (-) Transcript_13882:121-732(-)
MTFRSTTWSNPFDEKAAEGLVLLESQADAHRLVAPSHWRRLGRNGTRGRRGHGRGRGRERCAFGAARGDVGKGGGGRRRGGGDRRYGGGDGSRGSGGGGSGSGGGGGCGALERDGDGLAVALEEEVDGRRRGSEYHRDELRERATEQGNPVDGNNAVANLHHAACFGSATRRQTFHEKAVGPVRRFLECDANADTGGAVARLR